jgi:hypothetical protein
MYPFGIGLNSSDPEFSSDFTPNAWGSTVNVSSQILSVFKRSFQLMVPVPYTHCFHRKPSVSNFFVLSLPPAMIVVFTSCRCDPNAPEAREFVPEVSRLYLYNVIYHL